MICGMKDLAFEAVRKTNRDLSHGGDTYENNCYSAVDA